MTTNHGTILAVEPSSRPFAETLRGLLDEQEVSQRELARRCEPYGWGSKTVVNLILQGEVRATMKAMETMARSLDVKPEVFAEYRLGKAREALDPDVVGLKRALRNLLDA